MTLPLTRWDLVANKDDRLYRTSRSYVESKLTDVSWAQVEQGLGLVLGLGLGLGLGLVESKLTDVSWAQVEQVLVRE